MARDRIANLRDAHPTPGELREAALRYLAGVGPIEDRDGFFVCYLPGDRSPMWRPRCSELEPGPRGFEAWRVEGDDGTFVNIVTRQADEFTNAVADGFFRAIARYWKLAPADDAPKVEE